MKKIDTNEHATDFKNLVDLMSVYAEATTRMAALSQSTQSDYLDLVDEHKPEYAQLQETLMQSEQALEVLARRHPEWFTDSRTVNTPYGKVQFRAGTKLEVPNEELTIVLIEQRVDQELASGVSMETPSAALLRYKTGLNLEALEKLPDSELAALRIKRVKSDTFKVSPIKVDLGKAVKAAVESEVGA